MYDESEVAHTIAVVIAQDPYWATTFLTQSHVLVAGTGNVFLPAGYDGT